MPTANISSYKGLFVKTANSHIKTMEACLSQLASGGQTEILDEIYRRAHSLKGSSGVMGYTEISDLCTQITTLIGSDNEKLQIKNETIESIDQIVSEIKTQLAKIEAS